MQTLEEKVEKVEERLDRLENIVQELSDLIGREFNKVYNAIIDFKIEGERRFKEWEIRFEKEKQEREEQRKKDWEEWSRKLEEERRQREEEHKQWLERFEKEKQEREEQRRRDWEEWSRKLEEERKQREEQRKKDWEEWERKFEQQKREDRKKWEDMVMRLGTLVEDIVAPSIPNIAKKYFGCVDIEFDGLRIKKRHSTEKGKIKEFDYILVCEDIVVVNETKANPRPEYAKEFVEFIKDGEFWQYFPEYKNKKLIPIFSTLYMPENIIKYLTDNGIYAMAMKGDEMDILNYQEVNR